MPIEENLGTKICCGKVAKILIKELWNLKVIS